jgi:hypothetical protein
MLVRKTDTTESRRYWEHVEEIAKRVNADPKLGPAFREWLSNSHDTDGSPQHSDHSSPDVNNSDRSSETVPA